MRIYEDWGLQEDARGLGSHEDNEDWGLQEDWGLHEDKRGLGLHEGWAYTRTGLV
jgi:hypothetical protein